VTGSGFKIPSRVNQIWQIPTETRETRWHYLGCGRLSDVQAFSCNNVQGPNPLQKHFKLLLCVIFKQEWAVSDDFVCRGHCKLCTMFVKTSSGRHCISARYCSFGFKVLVSLVFLCFFLNPLGAKCDFRFVGHWRSSPQVRRVLPWVGTSVLSRLFYSCLLNLLSCTWRHQMYPNVHLRAKHRSCILTQDFAEISKQGCVDTDCHKAYGQIGHAVHAGCALPCRGRPGFVLQRRKRGRSWHVLTRELVNSTWDVQELKMYQCILISVSFSPRFYRL